MRLNRLDSEIAQEMLYLLKNSDCPSGRQCELLKGDFTVPGLMNLTKQSVRERDGC